MDNLELIAALDILEKEKDISKDVLFESIENALITAYKNSNAKAENVKVTMNRETGEIHVYSEKDIVEEVEDKTTQISLEDARKINKKASVGETICEEVDAKDFGRIAVGAAKNVITQKIREEERKSVFNKFSELEKSIVTGVVQRVNGRNYSINLGKADAILTENEQVKTEFFKPTERIKLYVLEVKDHAKGPRIIVSRTHPDFVKKLFEAEVSEVKDGTVEIKSIAREAGSRTKIAVYSHNPDVDPIGACVGQNGARVNSIVSELRGEKIDIINWDENPAVLIENALRPAKVITVIADEDEKSAKVIVPDYQLSLAIGKEGQNARLAARLTGFKVDIRSESQAADWIAEYFGDEYVSYSGDEYDENYDGEYDESYEENEEGNYDE